MPTMCQASDPLLCWIAAQLEQTDDPLYLQPCYCSCDKVYVHLCARLRRGICACAEQRPDHKEALLLNRALACAEGDLLRWTAATRRRAAQHPMQATRNNFAAHAMQHYSLVHPECLHSAALYSP